MRQRLDDDAAVVIKRALKPPPTKARVAKRSLINLNEIGCQYCGLRETWDRIRTPRMPLSGARNAEILMLGEAPGEQEDRLGAAFVGPSGNLLRQVIPSREMHRVALQNMVRCRPDKNRDPTPQETYACSGHLADDINRLPLRAIVGVGSTPLRHFMRPTDVGILAIHGMKFPVQLAGKNLWYYPIYHPSYVLRSGSDRSPAYPTFRDDMKHFFQNVEKWPEPYFATFDPQKVIIAHDEATVRAIVQRMRRPIAWDIETSTLRPFATDAKILTSAFSDGDLTVAFACQHPAEPNDWGLSVVKDIVSSTPVICHNAAFEMLWYCAYFGLEALPRQFHDTMVLARLIREQPGLLSLAVLSRIYLGVNVKQISHIDAARVLEYPLPDVLQYNGLDAEATALLFHCLDGRADDWQVNKVLCTIRSTTAMELVGLPVDLEKTKALNDEWEARSAAAEAKARILQEVRRFGVYEGKSFNIQSGKHVATGLIKYGGQTLPKTDKGADSTKREYLEALADSHPLAQLVCDYREANKLISTYIKPILSGTELAADGMIHPGYTTCHTATLRLSGNNMNIQNWPKRKHREIRKQIVAPKGQLIVSIDYGQIEARVIAMASRDRVLCDSIITGYDIHADWRDRLLKLYPKYIDRLIAKSGKTDDKSLMKAGRDNIKNDFVFASFFGSSPESCAKYTGLPLEVMQELSADFWDTFRGVRGWIKSQRRIHAETGTTSTLTGRVRRGEMEGNECINTPIQGTAADIVISAQNEVFELSQSERDPYLMPRIQVHDDLTFFLPDDNTRLDYYFKRISDILLKRRFSFFNVPLMVEVSVGHNWADTTEVVKYTGDYYK